ncbi:MAG: TetR/AcrR family transcriptional regulator [Nannocystis sp.]|nr:TetR/AcrR family transcriptional regulator [Nannocystis sp.]
MTRQKSDEQRKQQIRDAATRCFVRRGFAATRLLDIAREAGLSKGGVYFHYRAKEQLFSDILDAQIAAIGNRWSFEPAADQPAETTLRHLLRAHLQTVEDNPDETRLTNLLVSMAVQEAEFRSKLEQALTAMRSLYAGVIERGIREGVFRAGDPTALAQVILALVQGLGAHAALDSNGKLPLRVDDVVDDVMQMLSSRVEPAGATSGAN